MWIAGGARPETSINCTEIESYRNFRTKTPPSPPGFNTVQRS